MAEKIHIDRRNWRHCRKALEARFEKPIPGEFHGGDIELESLMRFLTPAEDDHHWRGRILIGLELRAALSNLSGNESLDIESQSQLDALFPRRTRKKRWQELQESIEWKLPRIGMPIWAQYLWGAGLLIGFVMMFVFPLWGLLVFFGGIILSFQVEKRSLAFQYPTVDTTVDAMVRLNWPAMEVGADGDDRLRMAFAEVLDRHFLPIDNAEAAFPAILVEDPFLKTASQWHLLHGDALRETFNLALIPGEVVVIRECYVVGPLPENDHSWRVRADFVAKEYAAPVLKYGEWVMKQLDRLPRIAAEDEVNLWFGDDLFCQVNLWFVVNRWVENGKNGRVFRIFPPISAEVDDWKGFEGLDESALAKAMEGRIEFEASDVELACALWKAFKQQDRMALTTLSKTQSRCFRRLPEVVAAHWARFPENGREGQPQTALRAILAEGTTVFEEIFQKFCQRQGIYGFTDLQVKSLLRDLDGPSS